MNKDLLFVYILPPLVGAVIGLFTNWLAIKMLFKPMKEVRILGMRVPFTPGILPRERFRLAESIGDTVAGDLLTEEVLVERIKSEEFRRGLKSALIEGGKSLSSTNMGDIGIAIQPELSVLVSRFFSQSLESLTKSEVFNLAAQGALKAALQELYGIGLEDIFSESFWSTVSRKFSDEAERDEFSRTVSDFFMAQLFKAVDEGKKPADFIKPAEMLKFLDRIFDLLWPFLVNQTGAILSQKKIRAGLEKSGAAIIRKTMERMNSVQRFFIGIGGYEKNIIENMPATISDFIETLHKNFLDPETSSVLRRYMRDSVSAAMDRPFREYASLSSEAAFGKARLQCAASLSQGLASFSSDTVQHTVRSALADRKAGDVLAVFPGLADSLVSSAVGFISGMCQSGEESSKAAGRILGLFLSTFSGYAAKTSVGSLIGLDDSRIEEISVVLASSLSDIAASQSARILKSVDVRNLVRDRINELDMETVEQIILRVMDKELKAVTWFGALLGGFMGLGQTIIALIRF